MAVAVKLLRFGRKLFFPQNGGPLKKGAMTPLSKRKGALAKKILPKCTDQVFLRYRFGKYQEIPTEYQPKIPNRYTTLVFAQFEVRFEVQQIVPQIIPVFFVTERV